MTMETKRGVVFVALAVLMVSGVLWVQNGLADPASKSQGELLRFSDGSIVEGSSAMLVRTDKGVTMNIHTSGLDPGAVYTVWWVIYNNPEHCQSDVCTDPPDFGKPDVQTTVLYATGHVIGNNGVGNFAAYLAEGDTSGHSVPPPPNPPDDVVFWLVDARKAQIELVVRSHGQPIPGMVKEQFSSFNGGCPPNFCESEQGTTPAFVP
jgi:hypothetical protein